MAIKYYWNPKTKLYIENRCIRKGDWLPDNVPDKNIKLWLTQKKITTSNLSAEIKKEDKEDKNQDTVTEIKNESVGKTIQNIVGTFIPKKDGDQNEKKGENKKETKKEQNSKK